jgi:CheY-like chemotaxis protein
MMKVELAARYQTVEQVIADLEAYESSHQGGAHEVVEHAEDEIDESAVFVNSQRGARAEAKATPEMPSLITASPAAEEAHNGSAAPVEVEARPKNVLCVESQELIQDAFRKALSKMGYRVVLIGDPERAAERYREEPPDAVIFDADGLGPDAVDSLLDMHEKAHEDGRHLSALVLLGPRQMPLREKLPANARLVVLAKPIKMKQVQDAINQLVPVG